MIKALPEVASFEEFSRTQLTDLIFLTVTDDPSIYLKLDIEKGNTPASAIAVLLANASAAAQKVFMAALDDALLSFYDDFISRPLAIDELSRILDVVEIAVTTIDYAAFSLPGLLGTLSDHPNERISSDAARILSIVRGDQALQLLSDRFNGRRYDSTAASYLIGARSSVDPLTAFDLPLDKIDSKEFSLNPAFILAVQAAINAMFKADGRCAREKIADLAKHWPVEMTKLVLEILNEPKLSASVWAAQSASKLSEKLEGSSKTGKARHTASPALRRITKRRNLNFMGGFGMYAALKPRVFENFQAAWMDQFLEKISDLVGESYGNFGSFGFQKFERSSDTIWATLFDGILGDGSLPLEVCFEMFYLDETRASRFDIIEFGQLNTFSVLYQQSNRELHQFLNGLNYHQMMSGEKKFRKDKPKFSELFDLLSGQSNNLAISTSYFDIAGDQVRDHLTRELTPPFTKKFNEDSYFETLKNDVGSNPHHVVICDNVVASNLLALSNVAAVPTLCLGRVQYIRPVSIGIAFDNRDLEWGEILSDAFKRVQTDQIARPSLEEHSRGLIAIDADLSEPLQRMLKTTNRHHLVDAVKS